MTYKDLCADIAALGFETEFDSQERVLYATRRALMIIYTERPMLDTLSIIKSTVSPKAKIKNFSHKGGSIESFSYEAKAYTFRTSGTGKYKICEDDNEKIFEFSHSSKLHRGFLHGEGKIEFLGEYAYSVYDFYLFDEIYGESIEDIPSLSGYTEYDIRDYTDNFLSFVSQPTDEHGIGIADSVVRGQTMKIPDSFSGKINLVYKKAPAMLIGNPDEEILLPYGTDHLLALLASSFVWLDDDPDKAQYYMSLYREAMAQVKFYDRSTAENSYHTTNGWA